jgi:3-deoxy-D-arabino-heptulosonate 7-phosphate (DAHP) synthase
MIEEIKNPEVTIIAGPCSINEDNFYELFQLASMEVRNSQGNLQRAVSGVRVVGLKSRTYYKPEDKDLGIDYPFYLHNLSIYQEGGSIKDLIMMPGIEMAKRVANETGLLVATEIVSPLIQVPLYERLLKDNDMLLWNPAVSQIGWHFLEMAQFISNTNWKLGLKNPKWQGKQKYDAVTATELSSMEKAWLGLSSYAAGFMDRIIFIHRGVNVAESGMYRNLPLHDSAKKIKKITGAKMYFDPSHSFGAKLRDKIVDGTIEAMKMMFSQDEYLYDGILIEAGSSRTDSGQHITHTELQGLVNSLTKFRDIAAPVEKATTRPADLN